MLLFSPSPHVHYVSHDEDNQVTHMIRVENMLNNTATSIMTNEIVGSMNRTSRVRTRNEDIAQHGY